MLLFTSRSCNGGSGETCCMLSL